MFVWLVLLVSTKNTLEEQALEGGTEQSRQAIKLDRLTRRQGWQGGKADKAVRLIRPSG